MAVGVMALNYYVLKKNGIEAVSALGAVISDISLSLEESKSNSLVKNPTTIKDIPSKEKVYIYRYGGINPEKFVPSDVDVLTNSGLSFSTVPKPGAAITTIEDLNNTGVLYVIQDKPRHVAVYPKGGSLKDWQDAGTDSIWTQAVRSVVVEWDGVIR